MFIDTPASEPADPTVAAAYQAATAQFGFLPNWALAFGGRPAVLEAWQRLSSTYCTLAHSWMLSERLNLIGTDELGSILTDRASAPALSEVDRAVMDFADQVAGDASGITEGDVARLRGLGLSDTDVLDVALAAAARCFFAKVLDAVGAEADPELAEAVGPELTAAATLGRPVQPVDD